MGGIPQTAPKASAAECPVGEDEKKGTAPQRDTRAETPREQRAREKGRNHKIILLTDALASRPPASEI